MRYIDVHTHMLDRKWLRMLKEKGGPRYSVQPLTKEQQPIGEPVVAADATGQAGPGELVFVVGSREAAQAMPVPFVLRISSLAPR